MKAFQKAATRRVTAVLLALAALGLTTWLCLPWEQPAAADRAAAAGQSFPWSRASTNSEGPQAPLPQADTEAARFVHFANWINEESALRGTEMDGGWGLDASGRVQPSMELRRRFDYLLQLMGQQPLERISAHLSQLASSELPPEQAALVMQVWGRYLQLQQVQYRQAIVVNDYDSLRASLVEHQQARQRLLGSAWSHAFYAEEEAYLNARLSRHQDEPSAEPEAPLIDSSRLDDAARARLQQLEVEQQQWNARLAAARQELQALDQAQELSELQREQARAALLGRYFTQPSEHLRASALLEL